MAALNFSTVINLTTYEHNSAPAYVDKLMIGNEPDNSIWQYYIDNHNLRDKESGVVYANYTELEWALPSSSITSKKCRDFGMKTFPGVGAIGFYTPLVGNSKFLVPIHVAKSQRYKAPVLAMTDSGTKLTFTITPPSDITYSCYRILLEHGYDALEYITYETTLVVDKPTIKGEFSCYCIGYVGEGSSVSEESNTISLTIATGSEDIEPITPSYYTVAEVDRMVQLINQRITELSVEIDGAAALVDSINGEVI